MAAASASLSHLLLTPRRRTHPNPSHHPSRPITTALPRRRRPAPAISAAASDLLSPAPSLKSRLATGDTLYGLFLLAAHPHRSRRPRWLRLRRRHGARAERNTRGSHLPPRARRRTDPAAATEAVSHCRYLPCGVHGTTHPIARASTYGLDDSYPSHCKDDTFIIYQVEIAAGIAEVDAIAAVD